MKTPHVPLPPASRTGAAAAALALFLFPAPPLHAQQPLADDPGVAEALHLLDVWMDAAQAYGGIPGASLSVVHDALLDRNTLREMHRVHWLEPDGDTTYGLGFSVWKSDGDTFVGHGGSCPGYRSHLLLRPQDQVATAFMTNGQGVNSRRFAQTAHDIVAPALRKAAGKPDRDASSEAEDVSEGGGAAVDETLVRFTGTCQRPLGGESAVLVRDGDLHVLPLPTDAPLDALTRLRHIEDGTFRRVRDNGDLGEEFVFEETPDGRMLMWRNNNYSIRSAGM